MDSMKNIITTALITLGISVSNYTIAYDPVKLTSIPALGEIGNSDIQFTFESFSEELPEECAAFLPLEYIVSFEPSYKLLAKAAKEQEEVNVTVTLTKPVPEYTYCSISKVEL